MPSALDKLEALVGGTLDDRYRVDALLGRGGMGAVFRGLHLGLKREVAIKVLYPDIGADPAIAKRFEREALSASRLDHPHCVRVTDFGCTAAGMRYLVMELLTGSELSKRLGQPWPLDAALDVVEQVLEALVHAHQHGIVHRDLKPENVFLTTDFRGEEIAKIVDFGIAKLLDGEGSKEALTRAGMVFGTPRYMSPEQASGGKVDERTDLYALGIIAFELLSGDAPFDAEELPALLRMQILAPPPPLPDSVPAEVAKFVEKLLEKSRHDRPESARAALDQLRAIRSQLAGASVETGDTLPPAESAGIPSAIPADIGSLLGTTLVERYRLDALLGEGGMGAVFRAHHLLLQVDVAVKVLHPELGRDPELSARFDREAQSTARLEHPNIVSVREFGSTPSGLKYLVMPLLSGGELRGLLRQPIAPQRLLELAIQLFSALEHAHGRGVIHRDLKPENLFVVRDEQGRDLLKLVDFGLAKLAEGPTGSEALTRLGQVFGTPTYMSPEQAQGAPVDARTDLYSAGIILYELLAGRPPFVDEDLVVLMRQQVSDEPPPLPPTIDPALGALRDLIMELLAKDRERRPPDAASVRARLEALRAAGSNPTWSTVDPMTTSSPSHASNMSMPWLGAPPPTASGSSMAGSTAGGLLRTIPRKWLYVGAGVLGLLIIVAAWPHDDDEPSEDAQAQAEPEAPAADEGKAIAAKSDDGEVRIARPFAPKPSEDVYIEIDKLLTAQAQDAALEKIRAALKDFPQDAGLTWREGRALALSKKEADRQTALQRYGVAVELDPSLLENTEFHTQLYGLLRDPKLREAAIDLSVTKLGAAAHSFLLELINVQDAKQALGWTDRHRILAELAEREESQARVDLQLNLARDLYQAKDAPQPCTSFAATLDEIEARSEPYFLEHLASRSVEIPTLPGGGEDASKCTGLDARLQQVRGALAVAYPDEAARVEKSKKGKKKRGLFGF